MILPPSTATTYATTPNACILLHIFQLAFSSQHTRNDTYRRLAAWDTYRHTLPTDVNEFDWRTLQQEYRDYIDLAKMAQLVPVIGAPVGAIANFKLIEQLGEMAMNCYRMRHFAAEDAPLLPTTSSPARPDA